MKKRFIILSVLCFIICISTNLKFSPLTRVSAENKSISADGQKTEKAEKTEILNVNTVPVKIEIVSDTAQKIKMFMSDMTIEQKTGQMFFCAFRGDGVIKADKNITNTIKDYHPGGVALFSENIQSTDQVTVFIHDLQQASDIPLFIGADEEGGRVLRTGALDVPRIPSALSIGKTGDAKNAYDAAKTMAGYLLPLGINVDFAPVADVFTNPSNTAIGNRAFSSDANIAGEMSAQFTKGLIDNGILATLKHFPGHGDTTNDSHYGTAATEKTLEELSECEFIPFKEGIEAGADFVMVGHISAPNIINDNIPATFSSYLLKDILRGTLGFKGIIITDSLSMGAIINYYTSEEAAVKSVSAGVDMLLMPQNLGEAYNGILNAVKSGKITEERINESAERILTAKYNAGLIKLPDNKQVNIRTYNINDSTYFKLRDLAYILNGTEKQFEIGWDSVHGAVSLTSGKAYTEVGGEMSSAAGTENKTAAQTATKVYLDGKKINLTAYHIAGINYFKLRDIGKMLNFCVTYDTAANTVVIDPNKSYTED